MYVSEPRQWFSARDNGIYYFVTLGDITGRPCRQNGRPNDDQLGDMVALEHIALLGEGHCLTLIQQLVGFVKRRGSRAALAHGMVYRLEGWFLR